MSPSIPRRVAEEPKRRNLDPEPPADIFLASLLEPDPQAAAESHLELAVR